MNATSRIILLGTCGWMFGAVVQAVPGAKRPELVFETRTREPLVIGVAELVPEGETVSAQPRYYRRLVFSGERHAATGQVLGKTGECAGVFGSAGITPVQTRREMRGEIEYYYDATIDDGAYNLTAREHRTSVNEDPWPGMSCNPPPSPLPLGFTVSEMGTPVAYGQWYISANNPLGLRVINRTRAADDNLPHYADYIGDGFRYFPTHSLDNFQMVLLDEDTPDAAEKRARVATVTQETNPVLQSSLRGSRAMGLRWRIREVTVQEKIDNCPGHYLVTRSYQRRPLAAVSWESMPDEYAWIEIKPGSRPEPYDLPTLLGYEIRLTGVTYEPMAGDCADCGSSSGGNRGGGAGAASPGFGPAPGSGSILWNLALGPTPDGGSAGVLSLYSAQLESRLYSPSSLRPAVNKSHVQVVSANGAPRQITTPEAVADLVVTSPESYEIRFYRRAQAGVAAADGLRVLSGEPYLFWRVENPTPGTPGRWRVTRFQAGVALVTEADETQPGRRIFSEAGGMRITETTTTTTAIDREETIVIKNGVGEIASKQKITYRRFEWGEEKVKEIEDPDGAALTTTWSYTTNMELRSYGQVNSITRPDGSSETMTYDNGTGALLEHAAPIWKTSTTSTYTTRTQIDLNGDGAVDTLTTHRRGANPATLFGLTFTVEWAGGGARTLYRAVDPGAAWNTPSNIITQERFHTDAAHRGELAYRLNPDGTLLLRRFTTGADGGKVLTEEQGASDSTRGQVVDGTRTIQTYSARGSLVSTQSIDIVSGRELQTTVVTDFDSLGRALRIVHPDGAVETRAYCEACGALEAVTIRGETTRFVYDALGRQTEVIRSLGSTVTSQMRFRHDAQGRLLRQIRVDPADGVETVINATVYDVAGRILSETNLGRGTTTYTYAFGPANTSITTTTMADGGTRIETRAASGSVVSIRGTAVPPVDYDWTAREWWGGGVGYTFTTRRLNDDGSALTEAQSINFLGEVEYTTFGNGAQQFRYLDAIGRLNREVDADGVATLYAYDTRGRLAVTALDVNRNGVIDYAGTDRIARTRYEVGQREALTVHRSIKEVWATEGQDLPTEVAVSEVSVNGLQSWQTSHGLTSSTLASFDAQGGRVTSTTAPDGTISEQVMSGDRLVSVTTRHPAVGPLASTTNTYDSIGRLRTTTDARNGTTTFAYNASDQLVAVTTPDPDENKSGDGYDPQLTRYSYDVMGRVKTVTEADGGVINTTYYVTGGVKRTWGARTYPIEYAYDRQGRLKTMTTWQNFAGDSGRADTVWNYDNLRGWLSSKRHADGSGPTYSYTAAGRLRVRTWARGLATTYVYNNAGEIITTDYSDATPDVSLAYDRVGRIISRTDGTGTCRYAYERVTSLLIAETHAEGLLAGFTLNRGFDAQGRFSSLGVAHASASIPSVAYAYDAVSRLKAITSGTDAVSYGYLDNSPLAGAVTFSSNGITRLTTTKAYDHLNRLTSIANVPTSQPGAESSPLNYFYAYNSANQRTRVTRENNSYWNYSYDALGQVTAGSKFMADGTPLLGHDYGWSYDDIGNRKSATVNGQVASYTANPLNQYASRSVPGVIDVLGAADPAATVTLTAPPAIPTPTPVQRQGELFYKRLTVDNSAEPAVQSVEVAGTRNLAGPLGEDALGKQAKQAFVPRTPEPFTYDADGNLKSDARWTYLWDGENRLIGMETALAASAAGLPRQKLDFAYDAQSRRIAKTVTTYVAPGLSNELHEYFPNDSLSGRAAFTTQDNNIDGFWAAEPADGFPADGWSLRVTATVRATTTGSWMLTAIHRTDDGVRLWIDGQLVIDRWTNQDQASVVTLSLVAGREYALRYEFRDPSGPAQSQLRWSGPGTPDQVVPHAGTAPVSQSTRFIYDGWNLLAELNGLGALSRTYVWGLDVSGTIHGAGGVGGLILFSRHGISPEHAFCCGDGNGNVSALISASGAGTTDQFDYSPFGDRSANSLKNSSDFPFGYSSRYIDCESSLQLYGLRFYDPRYGRWISKDIIGENGGANTYGFVSNSPIGNFDVLGLILAAFDGTNNDRERDRWARTGNSPTNVAIMAALYNGPVIYRNGVGTRTDIVTGNLFGGGMDDRLEDSFAFLKTYIENHQDEKVDIVGFSRGAAAGRVFANMVKRELPCTTIRFLGLFDTVAQIGVPNPFNFQWGYDLDIDVANIGFTAHAVAQDEHRRLFPLTSISKLYASIGIGKKRKHSADEFREIIGANYWEKPFAGVHSDAGGGYQDGRNLDALRWMIQQGQNVQAPFRDLERYEFFDKLINISGSSTHESRYPLLDRIPFTHIGRKKRIIFPGNN